VTRTLIVYDGVEYTVANRTMEEMRDVIETGLSGGAFTWLEVNRGEGRATPSLLLVSSATQIALVSEGRGEDQDDFERGRFTVETEDADVELPSEGEI